MHNKLILILFILFSNYSLLQAQTETAAVVAEHRGVVNQKAPPLVIQEWIKGEPVPAFEPGMIYVVEFSFIECPPCRKSIPHLTRMAQKYKGKVKVIGVFSDVSCKEDTVSAAYLKKLRSLVTRMDTAMDYIVGADKGIETTYRSWGSSGFPSAQVVDGKGMVVWRGGAQELDPILATLTAGKSLDVLKDQENKDRQLGMRMRELEVKGQVDELLKIYDSLIVAHPEDPGYYSGKFRLYTTNDQAKAAELLAWMVKNKKKLHGLEPASFAIAAYTKFKKPDYGLALAAIDWAIEEAEFENIAAYSYTMKADIFMQRAKTQHKDLLKKEDVEMAVRQYENAMRIILKPHKFKKGEVL